MAGHTCPVWLGYVLASPVRKLLQDPGKILAPHVRTGMTVLDAGCAMGFFSLPLARAVLPDGIVICVDIQEKMLAVLRKKAARAGLQNLEFVLAAGNSLNVPDYSERVDFAVAFAVLHEVHTPAAFLKELHSALKPGGRLLLSEPSGHVDKPAFEASVTLATGLGFHLRERPPIRRSHVVLLQKPG